MRVSFTEVKDNGMPRPVAKGRGVSLPVVYKGRCVAPRKTSSKKGARSGALTGEKGAGGSAVEYILGQEGRYRHVGQIYDVADP